MHPAIELFRGIAAWMVLTTHYARFFTSEQTVFGFLWTGVDFFFVISGFVFARVIFEGRVAVKPYIVRRFFRIYPLYALSLVFYYLATPAHADKLGIFVRHLFFLQTTSSKQEAFFFNGAFWTLPVEMEFYLLVPLLVLLVARFRYALGVLIPVLVVVAYFIAERAAPLENPNIFTLLRFHIPVVLLEFSVGIILFRIYSLRWNTPPAGRVLMAVGALGIVLLGALAWYYVHVSGTPGEVFLVRAYFNLYCAIGYALFLFPFLFWLRGDRPPRLVAFCLLMGSLSYGVYLLHNLYPRVFAQQIAAMNPWAAYFLGVLVTGVLAFSLYHLVENPARRLGRGISRRMLASAAG